MIVKTKFKDLFIFKNKSFKDKRGYFKELIKEKQIKKKLPFTVMSYSKKNVIRGLHIQTKKSQGKFISALKGRVYDVAVDLRKNSKTFGKYFSCILSEKNSQSIYIPPGFAHGFCGLGKENYIIYSCTQYRSARSEKAIKYNDKKLNIKWPIKNPVISKKDQNAITFIEFKKKYLK
jgi:dTDP-4-dehydrorhamnose 3,5-epimerase